MPLSRYQIRNEYSLADPELYGAADKDDPEALLEGVAMAGLIGLLRQLGDLAEFAAEIFHDLHEEVMVTATRGHGLMVRVQQLEAEFPAIEKALLSQTDHSLFFYNPGIDWHPNKHMDQNLITQGDLPRFIMDSYEECRGPPRLFLLDKFDVAGAGACLKRYTDPSFFKHETASFGITGADIQREKKVRKAKKKGSCWRKGETPEALPSSHAKLHQLFLEESIENGISGPAHRLKLKRRLNGFPFHSKSGKSYMETFLKSPSPGHKEVHEIPDDSSLLALPSNSDYESGIEIVKFNTVSPEKESKQRSISQSSSPIKEITGLELSIDELNEIHMGTEISEVLETDPALGAYNISDPGLEAYNIPSTLYQTDSEKDIAVGRQSKTDESIDHYQSDDIASEIDNYMDALTTMESEMDTDSELKAKNDLHCLNRVREATELYANAEQLQSQSSDSQSMGHSTLSDDGNSSLKKDMSSFSYSDTHSIYGDNSPSDGEVSSNVFLSTEIHEPEIIDASVAQHSTGKDDPESQLPEIVASDGATVEVAKIPEGSTELGDPTSSSSAPDSAYADRSAEVLVAEGTTMDTESDQLLTKLSLRNPCISSKSDASEPNKENSSARLSGEKQHMDEFDVEDNDITKNLPCASCLYVPSHAKDDIPLEVLAENQLVDGLNDEGLNLDERVASAPYLVVDSPQTKGENSALLFAEDQPLNELHGEDPNFNENVSFALSLSDVPFLHRHGSSHSVSAENLPGNELCGKDPNSIVNASVSVSNIVEVITEKKINDNSLDSAPEIGNMEVHCVKNSNENQQNSVMLLTQEQPLDPTDYLGIQPGDSFSGVDEFNPPSGEIALIENPREGIFSEFVEFFVSETIIGVPPVRSSKEGTSYLREDHFDDSLDTIDGAVMGEASCFPDLLLEDCTGGPSLLARNPAHLDEIDTESVNGVANFSGPCNESIEGSARSSADPETLQGGSLSRFEGEHTAFRNDDAGSANRPWESVITEDADQQNQTPVDNYHPESQILSDVSDTYFVSEAKSFVNLDKSSMVQLSLGQNKKEASLSEEQVESLPKPHAEKLPDECEDKSELLTQLQQTQCSDYTDHVGLGASSGSLPANLPSQPSLSLSPQRSNKIDISEQHMYQSSSTSSSSSLLPDANQIYVEEMPPMPPLPPVQWRMGRFQPASQGQEGVFVQKNAGPFPPLLPSKVDQDAKPVIPLLPQSALGDDKSFIVSEETMDKAVHFSPFSSLVPSAVHLQEGNDDMLPPEGTQSQDTAIKLYASDGEMQQNHFQVEEREREVSRLVSYLSDNDRPSYSLGLSHEEFIKPLNGGAVETGLKEEHVQSSALSEENVGTYDATGQPSKLENDQPQQAMPDSAYSSGLSSEKLSRPLSQVAPETSMEDKQLSQTYGDLGETLVTFNITPIPSKTENEHADVKTTLEETLAQTTSEDDKPNGHRPVKVPRPWNPIIDAVAAHDKSKLRKVSERVRPQTQDNERDSLLEQIRTKSFNLKPAVVSRPSIQGPKTNLKVAAILEKAKTIRQAFTGSDEDEDDSWSDS